MLLGGACFLVHARKHALLGVHARICSRVGDVHAPRHACSWVCRYLECALLGSARSSTRAPRLASGSSLLDMLL